MKKTYAEKRFFKWVEDDVSVSLRNKSGSYGGGSEVLVLQRRFSNIVLQDTNISPTIEAGGGEGGNNLPIILQSNQNNAQVYEDEETCPTLVASMGCGGGDMCR